jgi:hypothetical protein
LNRCANVQLNGVGVQLPLGYAHHPPRIPAGSAERPELASAFTADAVLDSPDGVVAGREEIGPFVRENATRYAGHTVNAERRTAAGGTTQTPDTAMAVGCDAAVRAHDLLDAVVRTLNG